MAKYESIAKTALAEAYRCDAFTVMSKAGRDPDLASVRKTEWFERLESDALEAIAESPGLYVPGAQEFIDNAEGVATPRRLGGLLRWGPA